MISIGPNISVFILINRMSKDVFMLLKIASRIAFWGKKSPSDETELYLSLRPPLHYSMNLVQVSLKGVPEIPSTKGLLLTIVMESSETERWGNNVKSIQALTSLQHSTLTFLNLRTSSGMLEASKNGRVSNRFVSSNMFFLFVRMFLTTTEFIHSFWIKFLFLLLFGVLNTFDTYQGPT